MKHIAFAALIFAALNVTPARAAEPVSEVRLYALDCGKLDLGTLELFEDTDAYQATPGSMVVPCFLVRHPKGDLIWDLGLPAELAKAHGSVEVAPGIKATVVKTLPDQLGTIGLKPDDIEYVGLSHVHFDHTGNLGLFPHSRWLISRRDMEWAATVPTPFGVDTKVLSAPAAAKELLDLDRDVFGDGKVRILRAPGHTPGHAVLLVELAEAGTVILSGDLYHTSENRQRRRMPAINSNRAETLASFDRIENLVQRHHARFVTQHDAADFGALPKFPAFLK